MSTSDDRPYDQEAADRESTGGRAGRRDADDTGVELHAPSSANELWDHNAYGRERGDVGGDAITGVTDTRDPRGGAPAYNIDAGDDDAVRHGDDAGADDGTAVRATGESLTGADATAGEGRESVGGAGVSGAGEHRGAVTGEHRAQDRSVVRHEERLRVGTEQVESGRLRLRKYVVEEPVRAEQTLVSEDVEEVRTPVTEAEREAFLAGQELPVGDDEVILYREVPVVRTVRVPYERVRLAVRRTERTEVVEETLRKERVDVEED